MRLQRDLSALLISLALPAMVWAAASEMLTISSTPIGVTSTLCRFGTPLSPGEHGVFIQILDESVYYTVHGAAAVPSSIEGGLAPANTILELDRASDFLAVAVSGDARAYVVCVPNK